jgi:hypothetical protein
MPSARYALPIRFGIAIQEGTKVPGGAAAYTAILARLGFFRRLECFSCPTRHAQQVSTTSRARNPRTYPSFDELNYRKKIRA